MDRLDNKIVLISAGFAGSAHIWVPQLVEEGATVIIGSHSNGNTNVAETIDDLGIHRIPLDVTLEQSWQAAFEAILGKFGAIDVLINAAAVSLSGDTLEECTAETWSETLSVNLDGAFLGCKVAVNAMAPARRGSIINVSSVLGRVANGTSIAYTASMAGVRLLTRSVALYCAKTRTSIRCNSICSGYQPESPEAGSARGASAPTDIGGLVVYLASDASISCTGADFVADNAFSIA
jgi:3(or 17)beta-hydroxysteroid dehydrogenase